MRRLLPVGVVALVLLWGAPGGAALDPAYLTEDANDVDVVFSPLVVAKAEELGRDPVRIYEFVRNELDYQVYYGLMKGPEATLVSGAGNEYDLAALLVSMLRYSDVPARFVRGFISVPVVDAKAWTGAWNNNAARNYWVEAEPHAWFPDGGTSTFFSAALGLHNGVQSIRKLHVWVEALVPMARYRGSDVAPGDDRGLTWVPLDPSFKLHDWPGEFDPLGLMSANPPAVEFTYGIPTETDPGPEPYYETPSSKLPVEIFEDQVRKHLASNPEADGTHRSLEDVVFRGKRRSEAPGVLPTALPYTPLLALADPDPAFNSPIRSARLADLHTTAAQDPEGQSWDPLMGAHGEADYHYTWSIHVCRRNISPDSCATRSDDNRVLLRYARPTAELAGRRVTLTFPAEDPGSRDPERGIDGQCNVPVIPTLHVDGVAQVPDNAGVEHPGYCNNLQIVVETDAPFGVSFGHEITDQPIEAGGFYALALDAHDAGRGRTQRAADRLVRALEEEFPVEERPLSDGSGEQAPYVLPVLGQTNDRFLAVHWEAQEALFAGLMDLVAARYWEILRDGQRRLLELHHHMLIPFPSAGFVVSDLDTQYAFDVPLSARPDRPKLDIMLFNQTFRKNMGGVGPAHPGAVLTGHNASAAEHAVWEEVLNLEAVSTVKGLQIRELQGEPVAVVGSIGEAVDLLGDCSFFCSGVDVDTYCTLKAAFRRSGAWKASVWDQNDCPSPPPLTPNPVREVRIPRHSRFGYIDWTGSVFYLRDSTALGFIIDGDGGSRVASDHIAIVPSDYGIGGVTELGDLGFFYDYDIPTFEVPLDPTVEAVQAGDPVAVVTGNLSHVEEDLAIAGPGGHDLRLVRSYNSRSDEAGALGHGWIHTYEQYLEIDEEDPDETKFIWVDERGLRSTFLQAPGEPIRSRPWIHHELVQDPDGGFTLTTSEGMRYRFHPDSDADGRAVLEHIEDRNGNRIACEYDQLEGQLLRVRLVGTGRFLTFTYDPPRGHLSEIVDWVDPETGLRRHWSYLVDADGDLASYTDPLGNTTVYEYYSGQTNPTLDHNLERVVLPEDRDGDGAGDVWMRFHYYANDTVQRHENARGETTYFSYNFLSRRTTVVQPDGSVETYHFDRYGNIIRHESGRGVVRAYEYDPSSRRRIREVDGFGLETRAAYDDRGNLVQRTDRLGNPERWVYNDFSQPLLHVDRRGHRRTWEYDAAGNLLAERAEVDGALQLLREHRYDARGNRIETVEYAGPNGTGGNRTRFAYDAAGVALLRSTDALGHVVRFEVDHLARPTAVEQVRSVAPDKPSEVVRTETVYDALDRPIGQVDAVGVVREMDYDANDNLERRTTTFASDTRVEEENFYDDADRLRATRNALGGETTFEHDPMGRVVRAVTPLGNPCYDPAGNVVAPGEPGHETRNEYDADGNRVAHVDASGARWRWDYDVEGRVVKAIDPLGQETLTSYDAEGRVLKVVGPDGRLVSENLAIDAEGNVTRVQDGDGHVTDVIYDELGRRTVSAQRTPSARSSRCGRSGSMSARVCAFGSSAKTCWR